MDKTTTSSSFSVEDIFCDIFVILLQIGSAKCQRDGNIIKP